MAKDKASKDTAEQSIDEQPQVDTAELQVQIDELTADLQRTRADFENYRRRAEADKQAVYQHGQAAAVKQILPIIDTIERAVAHVPQELQDNKWAQGVVGLSKNLDKSLKGLNLERIEAKASTIFNPELHEAVQFDEEAEGETEVIAEELQAGYIYAGSPLRHAMVKVTRQ